MHLCHITACVILSSWSTSNHSRNEKVIERRAVERYSPTTVRPYKCGSWDQFEIVLQPVVQYHLVAFAKLGQPKTFTDLNMLIRCFGFYQEHLPLCEIRIRRWRTTQKLRPPPGTPKDVTVFVPVLEVANFSLLSQLPFGATPPQVPRMVLNHHCKAPLATPTELLVA